MSNVKKSGGKVPKGASWSGAAFLVESMLLIVLLAVSMSVFVQVFGLSVQRSYEGEELSRAIAVAEGAAERFASNPTAAEGEFEIDGMRVVCNVDGQARQHGTLYRAVIDVYGSAASGSEREPVYTVSTARYVGEVGR